MYILKDKMNDLTEFIRFQSYDTKLTDYEIYKYVQVNHTYRGKVDNIKIEDKYFKIDYDEDKLIIEVYVNYEYLDEDC